MSTPPPATAAARRTRPDLCPGALRPWPAEDGLLVRLRLIGGRVQVGQLADLLDIAEEYGDGALHLTTRANLQLRALPGRGGVLAGEVLDAIEATGLLPSRSHELARNVMVSPQTGLAGGRADLRPVAAELDARLLADPRLAALPGRFLFVLDDGRGDLLDRETDLGVVALDDRTGQLRVGSEWGEPTPLDEAASRLVALAGAFVEARGAGPDAPWHVRELARPLASEGEPDERLPRPLGPLRYGVVPGGLHRAVADGILTRVIAQDLPATEVVVTPWRGVLVPADGR